ncbi:hypothetical protein CRG98_014356 [Punica granatum]|uniref:Uncharacterized protein n=1 Tax=Punica granatum TaxID=22663 RepID=A0A2I0K9I3_PUNGR|nr:hypothetical protein CRG98_014356 [Punica granatum]
MPTPSCRDAAGRSSDEHYFGDVLEEDPPRSLAVFTLSPRQGEPEADPPSQAKLANTNFPRLGASPTCPDTFQRIPNVV